MKLVLGGYASSSISSSIQFLAFPIFNYSFPCFNWNHNFNNRIIMSPSPILRCSSDFSSIAAGDDSTAAEAVTKPKQQHPWLIVGLGNPGKKYQATRHNVGFQMVDAIAEAEGISMSTVSFKALFGKGLIGNVPVMLAKPQTFMNASGESVGAIVSYYKIPLKQVLVIYDDLDLPFGKLRLLPKGGHGGQNGMRSIIDRLKGNRDFPRLRIGIGRPPGKMDAAYYVLRPFDKREREELEFTIHQGIEAIRILLLEGFNKSATFVNTAKTVDQCS
ncbi:peptidyl-tRNA hydrolase, mitochondrial [Mercurialis annua]|uniref:peptidyl-tRNA hydrolase, mitochondrial n=1 Tax=Mercurialis annua TaxID=3986 RepID=UPI00216059F6|nr:peptidyl-tRNA hydrolase, mitochondrial [Mercurialis annua]